MSFQEDTPRQTHVAAPAASGGAEEVVEVPDGEAAEEHGQAVPDHEPHGLECLHVAHVLVVLILLGRHGKALLLAREPVFLSGVSQGWAEGLLHGPHAAEDHDGGQKRVRILMEHGVLQVVVV